MIDGGNEPTTQVVPLPPKSGLSSLVSLFKRVIQLPGIMDIRVNASGLEVTRIVTPGEEVVPKSLAAYMYDDAFLPAILPRMNLSRVQDVGEPILTALTAFNAVATQGLHPVRVVAPVDKEALASYLGMEVGIPFLFGVPVSYVLGDEYHAQVIVLGGTSLLLDDITAGVCFDLETEAA